MKNNGVRPLPSTRPGASIASATRNTGHRAPRPSSYPGDAQNNTSSDSWGVDAWPESSYPRWQRHRRRRRCRHRHLMTPQPRVQHGDAGMRIRLGTRRNKDKFQLWSYLIGPYVVLSCIGCTILRVFAIHLVRKMASNTWT